VTVSPGEITAMHIGMLGTMAQLFLTDLSEKVKRGQLGRARAGKQPGGKAYGYDVVASGAGTEGGERRINDAEAAMVRRIFEEFAGGRSPREIAMRLNDEGVPGPGGRSWGNTTIRGQAERATGILNNALYVGRLEWNRCAYTKNPQTGKRVARPPPRSAWEVVEVPQLRIVDDALWQKVKTRQGQLSFKVGRDDSGNALNRTHRTKYLLCRSRRRRASQSHGFQRSSMLSRRFCRRGSVCLSRYQRRCNPPQMLCRSFDDAIKSRARDECDGDRADADER
jgi:hypothetical protein